MYKHAWECKNCPKRNDEEGCPAWAEILETNIQTGEERINKSCIVAMLPKLMVLLLQSGNRPAAAIESFRNEIVTLILNKMREDSSKLEIIDTNAKQIDI